MIDRIRYQRYIRHYFDALYWLEADQRAWSSGQNRWPGAAKRIHLTMEKSCIIIAVYSA